MKISVKKEDSLSAQFLSVEADTPSGSAVYPQFVAGISLRTSCSVFTKGAGLSRDEEAVAGVSLPYTVLFRY